MAERKEFFSTFITKLFPDIVLAQESIIKDFNEIKIVQDDSKKNVYTYYYKNKQSGVMVKKHIKSTEAKVFDTDLKDLNKLNERGVKEKLTLIQEEVEENVKIIIGSWSRKGAVKELYSYMGAISAEKL